MKNLTGIFHTAIIWAYFTIFKSIAADFTPNSMQILSESDDRNKLWHLFTACTYLVTQTLFCTSVSGSFIFLVITSKIHNFNPFDRNALPRFMMPVAGCQLSLEVVGGQSIYFSLALFVITGQSRIKKATQLQMSSAHGMGMQKTCQSLERIDGPLCSFWLAETNSELGDMIKLLEFTWTGSALFIRVFCASFSICNKQFDAVFQTPIFTGEVYKNRSMIIHQDTLSCAALHFCAIFWQTCTQGLLGETVCGIYIWAIQPHYKNKDHLCNPLKPVKELSS